MPIQRGTIKITISARIDRSKKIKDLLAKLFARLAARFASSKIQWEVRTK